MTSKPSTLIATLHPESVKELVKRLRGLFPALRYATVDDLRQGGNVQMDGYFVLFHYSLVHKEYLQAVYILASMIREHRCIPVDMECEGKIDPQKFRRASAIDRVHKADKASLKVVPVRVLTNFADSRFDSGAPCLQNNEFSIDTFSILLQLLLSDSLWDFSRTISIVGGDMDDSALLQSVHGGTPNSWRVRGDIFEVSPFLYESNNADTFVFPTGFVPSR